MSNLSAASLFIRLLTDPTFRRGKWEDRKFRYKFFLRCGMTPLTALRYLRALCELDNAERLLETSPTLPAKPWRPYLHKGGNVRARARAILTHYHFIQGLPDRPRQLLEVCQETPLMTFEGKEGKLITISCTPCGFDREGELMLILRFNGTVITRLSFSFIIWKGVPTLFIGGLQGPAKDTGPAVIKAATRACHGLFPRRLLCEVVSATAEICHVESIVAVSEHNHVLRQLRYFYRKRGRFVARYSECWTSVGGIQEGEFYRLPTIFPRKEAGDIPVRKRAEYRKRYVLLDDIRKKITDAS
ncbi:DUF535 domain-containing protein [Salmonella enterica subsp. enterica serovar Give]|uniref:DUF535 domain-containing protein n=1 Tax=Salmonella enterica subsp. enterica serovar Give TaxID=46626 RepID=A0A8E7NBA4_SALET|nr:VirK/YbjX family protein [Salmonella enterica]EBW2289732.1 DUF535 domain-containing protein [Salmonella enterica subsp. enterica serovar Newport]EDU9351167.1 DUF535 domain-containing protein [Salmonella enterica subsp. enterica]EEP8237725.1 DUF535 domain-containing protein [Salmonella enterica subsp. enterica serovar Chester]EAM8390652.1 DUF535 domain-containing protein [Salmonella enterica]EAX1391769.1 DUF535 domain-containing protein [Salmonella enterica]